ncbi:NADPH:adrenodoxin oxidoreductase, mitochondrial [Melanaphis sacchari]|uniref:NADPH:adrenodoxin oxidoreductase, mitochondrial n=1 Tax=Melanaphis sacchari TaxID=742174 RepID=UPI000DC14A12|nr:NADPH:adrenodoxin oxidoreductase, mitochondrial [Melanaphis sacchari]XP_025191528.1 NADPH:adrenodoxin oxidoreductase, mitochondrial [Melanaphis sacchari]XP_025191529.1 NADPH:adrenodoxin oxidoreductase, mitochondrial [Melanaphis sacchari]
MRWIYLNHSIRKYSKHVNRFHVGIVGAGPAGFYCAQQLLKKIPDCQIDIYERLPVPFGLVRYGVAPDHPEVKNVINTFTKTASNKNVRFIGNVSLGCDITLAQLKYSYNAIVLAYGADEDKKLNIAGENLSNVLSATKFIGWYNGLPANKNIKVDLDVEHAVIVGQGNVALDVARILLTPIDELRKTDITEYSLETLTQSKVKKVTLIGRRGPLQVAFTIKEFREMLKLPGVSTNFFENQINDINKIISDLPRPRRRLIQLMYDASQQIEVRNKSFDLLFLRTPISILGNTKMEGIELAINHLEGEKAVVTDDKYTLKCDIAFRSIGYRSVQADPDVPFNKISSTVPQSIGIYSVGWLSSGPVGVILSTMSNAFQAASLIGQHFDKGLLSEQKAGYNYISKVLKDKGIVTVDWDGWMRIDKVEVERGIKHGKPREKIVNIDEMLQIGGILK